MDLSGWVGIGLGGNCDCICGILYASVLGRVGGRGLWDSHIFIVVFLTEFTSPYSSNEYCLLEKDTVFKNLLLCPRIPNVWEKLGTYELRPKVSASCVSPASC